MKPPVGVKELPDSPSYFSFLMVPQRRQEAVYLWHFPLEWGLLRAQVVAHLSLGCYAHRLEAVCFCQ